MPLYKEKGRKVLITGANGFIGRALCGRLASDNDLTDSDSVAAICEKYSPDVVIHCAGIAHQKIGAVDSATYMRVNSEVTENLAKAAGESNPGVCFVFLSSVSIYGEGTKGDGRQETGDRKRGNGISEDGGCWPSSDYAVSKLDAERRLIALADEGKLHDLVILRLAPVYDREWSLNLDRRVFAPGKVAYLRFGSGMQRMSALARPNLVEFIVHVLQSADECGLDSGFRRNDEQESGNDEKEDRNDKNEGRNDKNEGVNDKRRCLRVFNVCDAEAYEFNRIIGVFKKSGVQPDRPVISVPLSFVWIATRLAGLIFRNKREWIHSCYDKLAGDLVFDNGRMMGTGFRAEHSLESIFDPQITQINTD